MFPRFFVLGSCAVCAVAAALGCGDSSSGADAAPDANTGWRQSIALPSPQSNNAVASVQLDGGCMVFSALGIDDSLAGSGTLTSAVRWREGDDSWLQLPEVPGEGRLAASAVGVQGDLYLLGGYSVGATGAETSHDLLQRFNLTNGQWESLAPIPTPIDDAVAVAWRDRWIVVVSGWSNTANVDLVQIYDVDADQWSMGTAFPGTPAFGHAGALSGDTLVVIDGAASSFGFPIVNQAWRAELDPNNPTQITWTDLGGHPGPPRYRAAGATAADGRLLFHGGTENPYNFDGLTYDDSTPAPPLATTLTFDPTDSSFADLGEPKPTATMDHRNLAECGERLYSVGGMVAGPAATAEVWLIGR